VASQSPCASTCTTEAERAGEVEYRSAWAAISHLVQEGSSWSGNERNCAYMNLGQGRFVDVSAVTGFDLVDDARCVATVDLDADGDQDLVLRNRTAPQLRILENRGDAGPVVALRLQGTGSNRDAVGAVVEATSGESRLVRHIACGSGYLAQSSRELIIPVLGEDPEGELTDVVVRWPGGAREQLGTVGAGRWLVIEGEGLSECSTSEPVDWSEELAPVAVAPGPWARVVLRSPLPLAPSLRSLLQGDPRPGHVRLVQLWAHASADSRASLSLLARNATDLLDAGLELSTLTIDATEDRAQARAFLDGLTAEFPAFEPRAGFPDNSLLEALTVVLEEVLGEQRQDMLPLGLLYDSQGALQVVYRGPLDLGTLERDARAYGSPEGGPRVSWPGFWLFRAARDHAGLARVFASRGLPREAAFHRAIARINTTASPGSASPALPPGPQPKDSEK